MPRTIENAHETNTSYAEVAAGTDSLQMSPAARTRRIARIRSREAAGLMQEATQDTVKREAARREHLERLEHGEQVERSSRPVRQNVAEKQPATSQIEGAHASKGSAQASVDALREELKTCKVAELRQKASDLGIDATGLKKPEIIEKIVTETTKAAGQKRVMGLLEITNDNYGFLRTENYMQGEKDAFVQNGIIRSYGLRRGDLVEAVVKPPSSGNKFPPVVKVEKINGLSPEESKKRPRFRDLTPVFPDERLVMEWDPKAITGRVIDLVAPIGKGQRGLIVSPPKAGKTTILKHICQAIAKNNPEVYLICLLVDERPEEVTDMRRSISGDVVASTFDMPPENHTRVAELVMERAKRLVEAGKDVVVVLDSITRLARAYNLSAPPSGRILSGGVDSAALYPPKHFLGAARNIEGGGSLTIIASALIETGSKMDEVIFEEFKGTGNMELKLDRELADKRIYPAVDPVASGTRNEELLLGPEMKPLVWGLRRVLANLNNTERAESSLVKGIQQTKDNREFLIRSAKKAVEQDYTA